MSDRQNKNPTTNMITSTLNFDVKKSISDNSHRSRRRRQYSDNMRLSRSLDFQQRLLINQQYDQIQRCFKILITLFSILFKWDWISDYYDQIVEDLEQSCLYTIMEQLCNIPLLELTCYPSLYRKLFQLYKILVSYGFIQTSCNTQHQSLSYQIQKLVTTAEDFLNMMEPISKIDIAKDGLISLSKEIVQDWKQIVY